jgi:RNA polymerase sigma-70 factor, ECF subfamily
MGEVSPESVEAFAELHDRFCNRGRGAAFSVCRDKGRAQDAVREARVSLWKSRASYRAQQGTVAAWLLTMVRYHAIGFARRNGNQATRWASDDQLDGHVAPDDLSERVIQRDGADHVQSSLARLSDEQQEVITLACYGQLSHTDIASQLNLGAETVKGRMKRGCTRPRERRPGRSLTRHIPAEPHLQVQTLPQASVCRKLSPGDLEADNGVGRKGRVGPSV